MSTSLGEGIVKQETEKALLVRLETGETIWIPKSVLHDDSEVYDDSDNDSGEVVVKSWWAESEGLA